MLTRSALLLIIGIGLHLPVLAQTPDEIVNVIRSSKLVDTKRELSATLTGSAVTISTFCDSRAADKDCMITALLILKELTQHYKTIRQARVSFYDEHSTSHYRTVVVTDKMVQLVDGGTPIAEVLSGVRIVSGDIPTVQSFNLNAVRPGPYYTERRELAQAIKQVIDHGGRPDRCVRAFAQLEKACAVRNPDRNYISHLYNSIVVAIGNEKERVPERKERSGPSPSEISNAVRQGLNNSGSGDLDGLIRSIENKVRGNMGQ